MNLFPNGIPPLLRRVPILLFALGPIAWGSSEEATPLRYAPQPGETLAGISERFQLQVGEIERLNPKAGESVPSLLLLRGPKNREEAIEILEEARHAESQGGLGEVRAAALFQEILRSADLVESGSTSERAAEPIEIPSDVVAQALLGWGRIHEIQDPQKSRWAYEQVETFFPDLDEFTRTAKERLAALSNPSSSSFAEPPPTALRWFPQSPHFLIDVDARSLETQFPDISLYQGLRLLEGSEEPEIAELVGQIAKRDERVARVLAQLESLHIGAWIDPELFGTDPERAMDRMTKMAVGHLRVTPEEAARNLDLEQPTSVVDGYNVWKLDGDTFLALRDEWALLSGEETLRAAAQGAENRSYPRLEDTESAYQRMRREVGAGEAIFVFADLEGFLQGPALSFARHVPLKDDEGFVLSLLVSGLLGINAIQGLALGLDFEGGTLTADLALAHGGRGLFSLIQSHECDAVVPSYLPHDIEGILALHPGCGNLLEPLSGLLNADWLGQAQPAFSAQYQTAVQELSGALGAPVDPLELLEGGFGREIGIGFRLVEAPIPFPNLILALPIGSASPTLPALERILTDKLDIAFSESEVAGQVYRHGLVPNIPLYIDLAYTVMENTLLVTTHSTLLEDAVSSRLSGETLEAYPGYRDLRASLPTPDLAQLYLSSGFTGKLASYGSSGLGQAMIHESRPALREIVKSTLAQVAVEPHASGVGIAFAEDRIHASLRLSDFRSWLVTALCVAEGRKALDERAESGEGPASQVEVENANPQDLSQTDTP